MPDSTALPILSRRKAQVFRLYLQGLALKQIAIDLELDQRTVSAIKRRLMRKLGIQTDVSLVVYDVRTGLLDDQIC